MRNLLASLTLLALAAGPADACMNDMDTDLSESEFRKRYESDDPEPAGELPLPSLAATSGLVLLLCGAGIVRKRTRA